MNRTQEREDLKQAKREKEDFLLASGLMILVIVLALLHDTLFGG